ncbi:MAG: Bifunctional ligase/repressor BirA [Candidatus Udaeobacter sp.]|nr:MAG: Bifunctional ligase/repressor BirA [Candidatus Udaeobacter sp.]
MPDGLVAEELQADLTSGVIGREIIVLEQTGSTNDAILQIANANSKEGLVVFAEHQTAGRGQRGNRWESAAGKGLWFSILLRPKIDLASSPQLTAWAAEAVSGAIQNEFSLTPTIKPPNDVQIDGRKVAGVLVEMRAQEKAAHLAIAGIGVNVNQSREDFPKELQSRAISLAMALGKQIDRQSFAVALLRNLDRTYREKFASAGL